MPQNPNPWYPSRSSFSTEEQHQAHVQTLNMVYDTQRKLEEVIEHIKNLPKSNVGQPPGGAINTTIAGIVVRAGVPTDGQTLKFVAKSGQWEFS